MRQSVSYLGALLTVVAMVVAVRAWTFPETARQTKAACASCHTNASGGPELTAAGKAYKEDPKKLPEAKGEAVEYVGGKKCQMCHSKEHKSWLETPHAKAFDVLKSADAKVAAEIAAKLKVELKGPTTESDGCVGCHVTGHKLAGGFPQADSAKAAALVHVTCEACHGPGAKHVAAKMAEKKGTINGKVTEKMCRHCHTAEMSPKFDFAEYKKRGLHVMKAAAK